MSEQPNEWTPEYVDNRLLTHAVVPWKIVCRIADAHNAALAAERKKVNTLRDIAERLWTQLIGGRKHLTSYENELRGGLTEAEEAK
jgi:hypothetical protein